MARKDEVLGCGKAKSVSPSSYVDDLRTEGKLVLRIQKQYL